VDWVCPSLPGLSVQKGGKAAMRHAKIEPFMEIYIDPELFRFSNKPNSQSRYITKTEIAFVACRITTSALNNGYSTHLVSYDTFQTKWRKDYETFTSASPSPHKLSHIIRLLVKHNIIGRVMRRSKTPIYKIGVNNPYHPDYKPVKIKEPNIEHKKAGAKSQKTSKTPTPKRLQSESREIDMEFENILTSDIERNQNEDS
jgi:hypothetical protein